MADPRYRKIPIQGRDGVVRRHRVKREHLGRYAKRLYNPRGKIVFDRKTPDQRIEEALSGTDAGLMRVKLYARGETGHEKRGTSRLEWEAQVEAVVPEDRIADLELELTQTVDAFNPGAGAVIGESHRQRVTATLPRLIAATVTIRDKEHEYASQVLAERMEAVIEEMPAQAQQEPEFVASIRRAVYDAAAKRWRDARTGRFTLDPGLLP